MLIFKSINRTLRDLLFLHIFKQDAEELSNATNTLFILSLVLLIISMMLSSSLIFQNMLDIQPAIKILLAKLDHCSSVSTLLLLISTFIIASVKTGAFERQKVNLLWFSYLLILVSVVIISIIFIHLVFRHIHVGDKVY